jgi:peptidoglycan hydrolase-like protein with peptidoglycan-binding domain
MKRIILTTLVLLIAFSVAASAQAPSSTTPQSEPAKTAAPKKKSGPVFRATKEQIMEAQKMLKDKGYYTGEATGKLDPATRAAIRKYQEAEKIKVTGTLNRETLEKMNIALTDKQKTM